MVVGIIVTHGKLADELLRTAEGVVGEFSDCYAVSNSKKAPPVVSQEIQAIVNDTKGAPVIVFIDFMGGSCGQACLTLDEPPDQLYVLSGVNLPMLLAFLNKRNEVAFDDLPREILERSQNSIQVLDPSKI